MFSQVDLVDRACTIARKARRAFAMRLAWFIRDYPSEADDLIYDTVTDKRVRSELLVALVNRDDAELGRIFREAYTREWEQAMRLKND